MNKLQLQARRNKIAQLIRISNRHKNCLKWSPNELDGHLQMKFAICRHLLAKGKEFYTEAIFNDGGRADIINADDAVIYEVVDSESEESINRKRVDYPLPIIVVKANQPFNEKLLQ
jgi:hypothetical protein